MTTIKTTTHPQKDTSPKYTNPDKQGQDKTRKILDKKIVDGITHTSNANNASAIAWAKPNNKRTGHRTTRRQANNN
jgi:hypothetical protein